MKVFFAWQKVFVKKKKKKKRDKNSRPKKESASFKNQPKKLIERVETERLAAGSCSHQYHFDIATAQTVDNRLTRRTGSRTSQDEYAGKVE